jgi:hypothetical protein
MSLTVFSFSSPVFFTLLGASVTSSAEGAISQKKKVPLSEEASTPVCAVFLYSQRKVRMKKREIQHTDFLGDSDSSSSGDRSFGPRAQSRQGNPFALVLFHWYQY